MVGDASAVFDDAVASLHACGIEFMLVGAQAFGLRTLPRTSYDVDFLVADDAAALERLKKGLFLVEESTDPVFGQRTLIFEVPTRVMPIELFVAAHWLTKMALARRVSIPVGKATVPVGTPEDLLLMKAATSCHPSRPSFKRATDIADLGMLIDAEPGLDLAYLVENARKLGPGVLPRLQEAGLRI